MIIHDRARKPVRFGRLGGESPKLALDSGPDGDVADLDVVGLVDGEGDRPCHRRRRQAEFVHVARDLRAHRAVVDGAVQLGVDESREIDVVRTTPSVDSWRKPSINVRRAFLVAAYIAMVGTIFSPAVDTVVTKWPRP
jgi:hypothetical protein